MTTSGGYEIGLLLRLAHRRAAEAAERLLAPAGLAGRDIGVLMILGRSPGLSQRELADRLGTDRTSMVRSLDRLAAAGAVSREPEPEDRRAHRVVLTPAGRDLLRELGPQLSGVATELLGGLDARERDELERLLRKVVRG